MNQATNEGPVLQPRCDVKVQELKNSIFKPGPLGHYDSVFINI